MGVSSEFKGLAPATLGIARFLFAIETHLC